jgi:nucleotide-binding universal stress UspA family protein
MLHVLEKTEPDVPTDRPQVLWEIEKNLTALIGEDRAGLRLCCRIEVGKLVPTLLQIETEIDADLLVMGVRPSSGFLDRLMWPNAYEIVRQAACPVLTVRSQDLQHS